MAKKVEEGAPAWMATFGDMMSLLLTFFVLLLSFATMDVIKFRQMVGSLKMAFGSSEDATNFFPVMAPTPVDFGSKPSSPQLQILDLPTGSPGRGRDARMLSAVERMVAEKNLSSLVEVENQDRGVVLRVKGEVLFDPASDRLRPESFVFLEEIVRLARSFPNTISIEGHTDDQPIKGSTQFPTNWHLSTARAISTLRYFSEVAGIDANRLAAAGYAHTRPLVPNDTPEHRATNRRVEFVFLHEGPTPDPGVQLDENDPARILQDAGAFD